MERAPPAPWPGQGLSSPEGLSGPSEMPPALGPSWRRACSAQGAWSQGHCCCHLSVSGQVGWARALQTLLADLRFGVFESQRDACSCAGPQPQSKAGGDEALVSAAVAGLDGRASERLAWLREGRGHPLPTVKWGDCPLPVQAEGPASSACTRWAGTPSGCRLELRRRGPDGCPQRVPGHVPVGLGSRAARGLVSPLRAWGKAG